MSSQNKPYQSARTPVRTRSHKTRIKQTSALTQRCVLQPANTPNSTSFNVPVSAFTFSVDLKPSTSAMPPKLPSGLSHDTTKKKVSKNYKARGMKSVTAANRTLMAVASSARNSTKRALSPAMVVDTDGSLPKRFKSDAAVGTSLLAEVDTTSTDGSIPPSSTDVSMSGMSISSEAMTISVESDSQQRSASSEEHDPPTAAIVPTQIPSLQYEEAVTGRKTPVNSYTSQTPTNAARIEISKTPKAPWLSGVKAPTPKISPIKKSAIRPSQHLSRTPIRPPGEPKLPTGNRDLFPSAASSSKPESGLPFATEIDETMTDSASSAATSRTPKPVLTTKKPFIPVASTKPWPQNLSAAFALPASLSPTKTPARPSFGSKPSGNPSPTKPKLASKPSILNRTGTASSLPSEGPGISQPPSFKPNLSSTLVALMNRTTVDPHAATQAQLSTLNQALEELDAPRPASSASQHPPVSRPSTSLGFPVSSKRGTTAKQTTLTRPGVPTKQGPRPGTSLGISSITRAGKPPVFASQGYPPISGTQQFDNGPNVGARRASTASLALSQSLPVIAKPGAKAPVPVYTTASGRRVVSSAARAAPLPSSGSKEKIMDNVSVVSAVESLSPSGDPDGASAAAHPATPAPSVPLEILKDCVIFVDVRTEDGEDAGSLFVDMLRGLGAKILTRPGGSLTHIVYKSGLQSTLTRYRALAEPKPAVVGIGWVVECVEKREKVDTTRYIINLEEEAGSVFEGIKPAKAAFSKVAPAAAKAPGKAVQTKLQFKPLPKEA